MFGPWVLLYLTVQYISKIVCASEVETFGSATDFRRPIWNVAHMVNALYQVDYYLDQGANSLEFDITFDWEGRAKYTFHGVPCDCFRSCTRYEDFVTYMDYLRKLTTPGHPNYRKELVLLFMDLKVHGLSREAKVRAGEDLALKMLDHYWHRGSSGAHAYVLISVPSIAHMEFVESFRRTMKAQNFTSFDSKIGFDFSGNENLDDIRNAYQSVNIHQQIWQGDGITNCLPRGTSRLRDALVRRDKLGRPYIDKVYWWTVDKMSTMRTVLRMNIDGMITNYPDRLVTILNEDEFSSKLRLATHDDNPWAKYTFRTASLMADLQQAREDNITDFQNEEDQLLYNC